MNNTTNIYIIGLGAIGCAFASQMANTGYHLTAICDEERREKYESEHFVVNGEKYEFNYVSNKQGDEKVDILLISVKYNQLIESIDLIRPFVSEDTIILSLLNGINSEEIIEKRLNTKNIIPAFIKGTDSKKYGNNVEFTQNGKIVIGINTIEQENNLKKVYECLCRVGVDIEISKDINRDLWWKFMLNVGINQISAIHRSNLGEFERNYDIKKIATMAMKEVIEIGSTQGIDLNDDDITKAFSIIQSCADSSKASMLQDVENSRETEVDMFAGVVCQLGKGNNIPTPINEFLLHSIKYTESKFI